MTVLYELTKMTVLYKLTNSQMRTYNGFQWELGVEKKATGKGELCGPGWLHAYTDPLLAVLLNPIHAQIYNLRLFRAWGVVGKKDNGLKVGCTSLTLIEEIPIPVVTTEQRVRFGILCAKEVYKNPKWNKWADEWLSGEDRSIKTMERMATAMGYGFRSLFDPAPSAALSAVMAAEYAGTADKEDREVDTAATAVAHNAAASAAVDAVEVASLDLARIAKLAVGG